MSHIFSASLIMDPEIERWRKYLRRDPTRFLLDAEANPSVYLWYLIDIAHRPEDARVVIEARDRVLYSQPVQDLFAAQQPEGFWEPADNLAEPRYRATLWNLALLAELGIPRDSRRARAGCEFVLQNFIAPPGHFTRLDAVETGYLVHALAYFNLADDERVRRAIEVLLASVVLPEAPDDARLLALWAVQDSAGNFIPAQQKILDLLLPALDAHREFSPLTFPQFDPHDPLFILRVLSATPMADNPALKRLADLVFQKQNEWAQWPLERSLNDKLITPFEGTSAASRWATLNAVRVIVRLVQLEH